MINFEVIKFCLNISFKRIFIKMKSPKQYLLNRHWMIWFPNFQLVHVPYSDSYDWYSEWTANCMTACDWCMFKSYSTKQAGIYMLYLFWTGKNSKKYFYHIWYSLLTLNLIDYLTPQNTVTISIMFKNLK